MSLKPFLLALLLIAAPFVSVAQHSTTVLPQDIDYDSLVSSQIYGNNFLSDPTREPLVAAETDEKDGLEIFIINKNHCVVVGDSYTFRILIRNEGDDLASDVEIKNIYSANAEFAHAAIAPEQPEAFTLMWTEFTIVPGDSIERTFTLTAVEGGAIFNDASVKYTYGGEERTVATGHAIDGICETPQVVTTPRPKNKFAAIICDISEIGCTEFLPKLGINFTTAQREERQPQICSQHDPRNCTANKPALGVRYAAAEADIKPGECRVEEDLGAGELTFRDERVSADVETTWCESNGYPEFVVRGAPEPVKAQVNGIRLPDTSDLDGRFTVILDGDVEGQVCGGKVGDPWWASDCSCQCGQVIETANGPVACQQNKNITRHDITITSPEECRLEGTKHDDPFF